MHDLVTLFFGYGLSLFLAPLASLSLTFSSIITKWNPKSKINPLNHRTKYTLYIIFMRKPSSFTNCYVKLTNLEKSQQPQNTRFNNQRLHLKYHGVTINTNRFWSRNPQTSIHSQIRKSDPNEGILKSQGKWISSKYLCGNKWGSPTTNRYRKARTK